MVMFTGCICIFVWLLINELAAIVFFACLYGFGTGNFTALLPSVVGQITPDENLGARVGAFYSIVAIASLVGTPIGSALITDDKTMHGYWWLIIFSVSSSIQGMVYYLTCHRVLQSPLGRCLCLEAVYCTTKTCERSGECPQRSLLRSTLPVQLRNEYLGVYLTNVCRLHTSVHTTYHIVLIHLPNVDLGCGPFS
jgi:MFS family permease